MKDFNSLEYLKKALFFVALAATVACTGQESTRNRAYSDGDFKEDNAPTVQLKNSGMVSMVEALIRKTEPIVLGELEKQKEQRDSNLLFNNAIVPIKEIVLNENYYLDPDFRNLLGKDKRKISHRLVNLLNLAIIMISQDEADESIGEVNLLMQTKLLQEYKYVILRGCNQNLRGSCKMIPFFAVADAPNMSKIMLIIFDHERNETEKTRLLKVALELKNNRLDENLRFMLMSRILESYIQQENNTLSDTRRRLDNEIFETILKLDSDIFSTNGSYVEMIAALNPWELTRNSGNQISRSLPQLLKVASEKFLYANSTKTKISKTMKNAIEDIRFRVSRDFELGVDFQKSNISGFWKSKEEDQTSAASDNSLLINQGSKHFFNKERDEKIEANLKKFPEVLTFGPESKNIIGSMLKDTNFKHDEYYFLAHQIYYDHYFSTDSDSFWQNTTKDGARLIEAATNLIKMQLVYNVVYTNVRMNRYYEDTQSSDLFSFLQQTRQEADFLTLSWEKINLRSQFLLGFINRSIPDSDFKNRRAREDFRNLVTAIKLNIKYIAAYPSMYPLMMFMTKNEMKKSFWFGTIDYETLVRLFFDGNFPPWFSYGGDRMKLDQNEVLISFYYTIVTQTMNSYKNNSKVGFDTKEFFEIVVKKFLDESLDDVRSKLNRLKNIKNGYKSKISNLRNMCEEELKLQAIEQVELGSFEELNGNIDYFSDFENTLAAREEGKFDLDFVKLGNHSIYPPNSNAVKDSPYKYFKEVYSGPVRSTLRDFQRGYELNEAKVRILLDIYKKYAGDQGLSDDGKKDLETIIQDEFDAFDKIKHEYTELFFTMHDELKVDGQSCEVPFLKRDQNVRYALLFKEAQFLGNIFEKIYDVLGPLSKFQRENLSAENEAALEQIREEFFNFAKDNGKLPTDYTNTSGFSKINGVEFVQYKSDYYVRLADFFLQKPFYNQYEISYPPSYINLDGELFEKTKKYRLRFDFGNKTKKVAKQDFIKQGLLEFSTVFPWAKVAPDLDVVNAKSNTLTTLFKLNSLPIVAGAKCADDVNNDDCRSISAEEMILYHKDIIDLMHYNKMDQFVANKLGNVRKYSRRDYERIIKKENDHKLYSYFDLIFKKVYSDAYVTKEEGIWFQSRLASFAKTVENLKKVTFIFPFDKNEIYEMFNGRHREWIADYFATINRFLKASKKLGPQISARYYRYEDEKGFVLGEQNSSENKIDPIISDFQYEKFETFIGDTNRKFKFYYRNEFKTHMDEIEKVVNE